MSAILVTGASGFIGQALAASLAKTHEVICMGRRPPGPAAGSGLPWVRGYFGAFEDLHKLDDLRLPHGARAVQCSTMSSAA